MRTLVDARYYLPEADATRLVGYLQERAEGNALFLGEVLRSLEEAGMLKQIDGQWALVALARTAVPTLLRQVIDGRVARLDHESRSLLAVAAIIGHEVPLDLWMSVAQADDATMMKSIEHAAGAGILTEAPDGVTVRFAHALIREAVHEGVPALRRRHLHEHVGAVLSADPQADPDAVAYHFQQVGDARAIPWLVRAGERAQNAYAWITASARYQTALALMEQRGGDVEERATLLCHLAVLRRYLDARSSVALLTEAERLALDAGDRALVGECLRWRGGIRAWAGDLATGLGELAAGVEILEALPAEERVIRPVRGMTRSIAPISTGRGLLIEWLMHAGRYAEAIEMGERFLPHNGVAARDISGSSYGDGLWGLGYAYAAMGRVAEARSTLARARATYDEAGQYGLESQTATEELRIVLAYQTDRHGDRRMLAAWAEKALARSSGAMGDAIARVASIPLLMIEGQWAEIRALMAHASHWSRYGLWSFYAEEIFALLSHLQGEPDRALAYVQSMLPGGVMAAPGTYRFAAAVAAQRIGARIAIDVGDLVTARAWLETHDRWMEWGGVVLGQSERASLWARLAYAAGDTTEAYAHAKQSLDHAIAPRQPLALLAAYRLLGALDTAAGRYDEADAHLRASLTLADDCTAPYERALTLLEMAERYIRMADMVMARTLLDEVRALCTPLEARPVLDRAESLSARLPTRNTQERVYPGGLSTREVEVLRLVAIGLSNPEVAERLYLSRRTIEQHLRSIYNKLGVSSRAAATHFAVTNGLA